MKIKQALLSFLVIGSMTISAQELSSIYDPTANAEKQVAEAIGKASQDNKNVLLMIGGNWCGWCRKLHGFINDDYQVDSTLHSNYEWVMVNYSKENKNLELLKELGVPQRMGFPVFVVLDTERNRLHTQNSWYLEKDKSYDRDKLLNFLKEWGPAALDPANHKDYQ